MTDMLKDIIDRTEYAYCGIRVDDDVNYSVGDQTAPSRIWADGDPTEDTLNGTSCIGLRTDAGAEDIAAALDAADSYYGNRLYLIAGDSMEYGEDAGEYIIRDAVVIAIIK